MDTSVVAVQSVLTSEFLWLFSMCYIWNHRTIVWAVFDVTLYILIFIYL